MWKLVEKEPNKRNKFIVTIIADSNDGDYISETETYSKDEFEMILPELINLRDNYRGSYKLENYPDEKVLPIPYTEHGESCHTLLEVLVEYIDDNGKLYDVEFKGEHHDT